MTTQGEPLLKLLSDIRQSGRFSDLEVKCGTLNFQVHCCIVCPQSDFFNSAVTGAFIEAKSHVITIHDEPSIASKMFDFLYHADYDDNDGHLESGGNLSVTQAISDGATENQEGTPEESPDCSNTFESASCPWRSAHTNAKMYVVADKYAIDGLKEVSKRKMELNMKNEWSEAGFITLIEYVYGPECPANSEISEAVLAFAIQNISNIKGSKRLHEILKAIPNFGYDLSFLMMEKIAQLEEELR